MHMKHLLAILAIVVATNGNGNCPDVHDQASGFPRDQSDKYPHDLMLGIVLKKIGSDESPQVGFPPKFETDRRLVIQGRQFVLAKDGFFYDLRSKLPFYLNSHGDFVEASLGFLGFLQTASFHPWLVSNAYNKITERNEASFQDLEQEARLKGSARVNMLRNNNLQKNSYFLELSLNREEVEIIASLLSEDVATIQTDFVVENNYIESWNRYRRLKDHYRHLHAAAVASGATTAKTKIERLERITDNIWWPFSDKFTNHDPSSAKLHSLIQHYRPEIESGMELLFIGAPSGLTDGITPAANRETNPDFQKMNLQNLWMLLVQKAHTGAGSRFLSLSSDPTVARRFGPQSTYGNAKGSLYVVLLESSQTRYNLINDAMGFAEYEYIFGGNLTAKEIVEVLD